MTTEERSPDCLQARKKALQLLEYKDRTVKGLSDRLRQAGFSDEAVRDAVCYMASFGYLNDERYAENYIRFHHAGSSRKKLTAQLSRLGVDIHTVAQAWETVMLDESHDERAQLRHLMEKKYGSKPTSDPVELRRRIGYFARRGFEYEDIMAVLQTYTCETEENMQE